MSHVKRFFKFFFEFLLFKNFSGLFRREAYLITDVRACQALFSALFEELFMNFFCVSLKARGAFYHAQFRLSRTFFKFFDSDFAVFLRQLAYNSSWSLLCQALFSKTCAFLFPVLRYAYYFVFKGAE